MLGLRRRDLLAALGGAVAATGAMAAVGGHGTAGQGVPLRLGVLLGLTGPGAANGKDCRNCIDLAIGEVNHSGGMLGRSVTAVVEDDRGDPKVAAEAAERLVNARVPLVIGGRASPAALAAAEIFNRNRVVWITAATANQLKTAGAYVFDVAGLADQSAGIIDFIKADHADRLILRIAGMFQDDPNGRDTDAVCRQRAGALGYSWVHSMFCPSGMTDFASPLGTLLAAAPDAIVAHVHDRDVKTIQQMLYDKGIRDFSILYGLNVSQYAGLDPKLSDGLKGLSAVAAGPHADVFMKSYVTKYGQPPQDPGAPPFYDATWIVAGAVNLANSLDPATIRDAMWPAAYRYLGVSGLGDKGFNLYGKQAADQSEALSYKGGRLMPYKPQDKSRSIITYRYPDAQGLALAFAPSAEDLSRLYTS